MSVKRRDLLSYLKKMASIFLEKVGIIQFILTRGKQYQLNDIKHSLGLQQIKFVSKRDCARNFEI